MRDEEGKGKGKGKGKDKGKMIFKIILTALMAASMAIPSAFLSGCSKTDDTSKEDNMNTYSIEKVEHEPGEPLTDDEIDELYGDGQLNSDWHVRKWYDISMEMIEKYQPDIIYYGYGINYAPYDNLPDASRYRMLANFYNQAKTTNPEGVVCNYKEGRSLPSEAVYNKERSSLADINPVPYQTDTSIGTKSWCYTTVSARTI